LSNRRAFRIRGSRRLHHSLSAASRRLITGLAGAALLVAGSAYGDSDSQSSTSPLVHVTDLPLPGGPSRFDYQSLNGRRGILYIAHLGADRLLAFDVTARKVVGEVPVAQVHGVLAVPRLGRVYASATGDRSLVTIDEHSERIVTRAPAGRYPDGIAYDARNGHLFVSDEAGGIEAIVDAQSGRRIGSVQLGGEAGNVVYDAATDRVLVAVQTHNTVAVIDPNRAEIVRRVPLRGCLHDHGLLVDPATRLAFVACDYNAKLLVLDLRTLKVTQIAAVGDGPDVLAFDPGLRRLYVAAEIGPVTVFAEKQRRLRKIGQVIVGPHAHTVAVDPHTHLVYFPLENIGGKPILRIMRGRPG
jgi:DNA-binding beta-propeller fold protein YncE